MPYAANTAFLANIALRSAAYSGCRYLVVGAIYLSGLPIMS